MHRVQLPASSRSQHFSPTSQPKGGGGGGGGHAAPGGRQTPVQRPPKQWPPQRHGLPGGQHHGSAPHRPPDNPRDKRPYPLHTLPRTEEKRAPKLLRIRRGKWHPLPRRISHRPCPPARHSKLCQVSFSRCVRGTTLSICTMILLL